MYNNFLNLLYNCWKRESSFNVKLNNVKGKLPDFSVFTVIWGLRDEYRFFLSDCSSIERDRCSCNQRKGCNMTASNVLPLKVLYLSTDMLRLLLVSENITIILYSELKRFYSPFLVFLSRDNVRRHTLMCNFSRKHFIAACFTYCCSLLAKYWTNLKNGW